LASEKNLGQFGKILECEIKQHGMYERKKYMVKFEEIYQASLAFKSINMLSRESSLRAYFSKNKFCIHFIRGNNCRKYNCPFIHDELTKARYFYKEDLNAEYFEDTMAEDELNNKLDIYLG
jgi:hypothetical protein